MQGNSFTGMIRSLQCLVPREMMVRCQNKKVINDRLLGYSPLIYEPVLVFQKTNDQWPERCIASLMKYLSVM